MTGRFLPVTYMPWVTCQVKAARPQATTNPSRLTSSHQLRLGGRREESSSSFNWLALLTAAGIGSDMLASSSLEVVDRRVGAEVLQQLEAPRTPGESCHPAVRIGQIAEYHRLARAGLGTGRLHLSVADLSPLPACILLGATDPLDAEGTLFHHPAAAHGDVGGELVVQRFGPLVGVEIEDPHGIGAVVAAVAGADAAVVDLTVEAVRVVIAGIDRTDRLAGGVMAMLAHDRQEADPHVRVLPHPEALDTQPLHGAPLADLLFVTQPHVVFRLAGDHAGTAACAAVQVDH